LEPPQELARRMGPETFREEIGWWKKQVSAAKSYHSAG
jgi:hypothetical protein